MGRGGGVLTSGAQILPVIIHFYYIEVVRVGYAGTDLIDFQSSVIFKSDPVCESYYSMKKTTKKKAIIKGLVGLRLTFSE